MIKQPQANCKVTIGTNYKCDIFSGSFLLYFYSNEDKQAIIYFCLHGLHTVEAVISQPGTSTIY